MAKTQFFKLYKYGLHIFLNVGVRGGRDLTEIYGNAMGNLFFFFFGFFNRKIEMYFAVPMASSETQEEKGRA